MKNIICITRVSVFFLLFFVGIVGYAIATSPQIPPEFRDKTSDWKTYRNEQHGFEVRYPDSYEVLLNHPTAATTISFRDKKYDGSFEWPGLSFYFGQVAEREFTEAGLFGIQNEKNEVIRIKFTRGSGQGVYASCTLYLDRSTINICNQILSTFKFIPLENQSQVLSVEPKESVEYTTPGGISPPLFRALQWLITLLIIAAFIFKFRPHPFKLIFSLLFTAISIIFLNSCFITDVSLPKLCDYRAFSFPVFIFVDPLGDNIRTAATRNLIMPTATPLIAFGVWYIIGSVLFAIYNRTLKK